MSILVIELIGVAFVYAMFSLLLQRRLGNVDKMYEIRARMNQHQKALMDLVKNNAAKEEISRKQKEVMDVSTESMKLQFKPMLVVFPAFILLYYVLLPMHFNMAANLTILSYTLSYHWFFVGILFVVGILLSTVFSIYDRRRLKDKYKFGLMQPSFKEEQQTTS